MEGDDLQNELAEHEEILRRKISEFEQKFGEIPENLRKGQVEYVCNVILIIMDR